MKTSLTISSLLIPAGYAVVDLAKTAGIHFPGVFNLGNAVIAFVLVSIALIAVADYGRKFRPIKLPVRPRALPQPHRRSIAAAYHHVYAIRRGAEAARLAAPNRIVVFPPKSVAVRDRRAA